MKIMRLRAGLGNQMFQYAWSRERELLHGEKIKFDASDYWKNIFKRHKDIMLQRRLGLTDFNTRLPRVWWPTALVSMVTGKYYSFYPYGEFREIRETLLEEFSLRHPLPPIADKIRKTPNSVAMHVRRGDYVGNPCVDIVNTDYFNTAIKYMAKKLKTPTFFLFSDDIDWVLKNLDFGKYPKVVVSGYIPATDMTLSSLAKHHIIPNSTFGWWAAWLNRNPHKIVIAPKRWFAHNEMNPALSEWIKL